MDLLRFVELKIQLRRWIGHVSIRASDLEISECVMFITHIFLNEFILAA